MNTIKLNTIGDVVREVKVEGEGSDPQVDDVLWVQNLYSAMPAYNFTKQLFVDMSGIEWKYRPFDDAIKADLKANLKSMVDCITDILISPVSAPELVSSEDFSLMARTRVRLSGNVLSLATGEVVAPFIGSIVRPLVPNDVRIGFRLYLDSESKLFSSVYDTSEYEIDVLKVIPSNGQEIEL